MEEADQHIDKLSCIPWASPNAWKEANASLDFTIQSHGPALGRAVAHANQIRTLLESTKRFTQDLCLATCPHCPEPCCAHAKVWLDFKDLLFLHLMDLPVPPGQLRTSMEGPCSYLGPRGCTLDRLSRPFVCFWYFCPSQTLRLSRMPGKEKEILGHAIVEIKKHRKEMEEAFMEAVGYGVSS